MNSFWLIRLYKESKCLFLFVFILCIGQWYFTKHEKNAFPWFFWSMYSSVESIPIHVNQYIVLIDEQPFDYLSMDYWSGIGLYRCTRQYQMFVDHHWKDPSTDKITEFFSFLPDKVYSFVEYKLLNKPFEIEKYPKWLHGFLEKKLNKSIQSIEILDNWYEYKDQQYLLGERGRTILKYER